MLGLYRMNTSCVESIQDVYVLIFLGFIQDEYILCWLYRGFIRLVLVLYRMYTLYRLCTSCVGSIQDVYVLVLIYTG